MSPALKLAGCPDGDPASSKAYFPKQDKLEGEILVLLSGDGSIRIGQLFFSWKDMSDFSVLLWLWLLECLKEIVQIGPESSSIPVHTLNYLEREVIQELNDMIDVGDWESNYTHMGSLESHAYT